MIHDLSTWLFTASQMIVGTHPVGVQFLSLAESEGQEAKKCEGCINSLTLVLLIMPWSQFKVPTQPQMRSHHKTNTNPKQRKKHPHEADGSARVHFSKLFC